MIIHNRPPILRMQHNALPTRRVNISMTLQNRRPTVLVETILALLIVKRSSRSLRPTNSHVIYVALSRKPVLRRIAAPSYTKEQVVELLLFMHNRALHNGSINSTVANKVVDAVVLFCPDAKVDHVVVRKELDLEDVVPEGAESEVGWGRGCFLEDVRVDEVVFGGEREVD
jgi:hypothetical protein